MSQRCPVCKTRLWTDALLIPGKLSCPRCGATFRPTVPLAYFRFLLLLVVTLSLLVILNLSRSGVWIVLFLGGVAIFFIWFLPRFIDLQHIAGELQVTEGPLDSEQMKLKLEDEESWERQETFRQNTRFRQMIYLAVGLLILLFILTVL